MSAECVSLDCVHDASLRSTLAELLTAMGVSISSSSEAQRVGTRVLALTLVDSPDELVERLVTCCTRFPDAVVVVLLPFWEAALSSRAIALGAAACHGLDRSTALLAQTIAALLRPAHALARDEASP